MLRVLSRVHSLMWPDDLLVSITPHLFSNTERIEVVVEKEGKDDRSCCVIGRVSTTQDLVAGSHLRAWPVLPLCFA